MAKDMGKRPNRRLRRQKHAVREQGARLFRRWLLKVAAQKRGVLEALAMSEEELLEWAEDEIPERLDAQLQRMADWERSKGV